MKTMSMALLISAQLIAGFAQAASSHSLVFCSLQNTAGQNGAAEVFTTEMGTQTIQISILGQTVDHKEIQTPLGTAETGVNIQVQGIQFAVASKHSVRQESYSSNDQATGKISADVLGGGIQILRCEYPRK
jgi:hypothetical protein